ncbi:MAG TPA: hypothetical protein VGY77_01240, partial [Gemmataceae bacterium]|nr:hypothetical protein [Gemmataceae bacterium]
MKPDSVSRILLCAREPAALEDVRRTLQEAGYRVDWLFPADPEKSDWGSHQAIVIDSTFSHPEIFQVCRRIRSQLGDAYVPILCV